MSERRPHCRICRIIAFCLRLMCFFFLLHGILFLLFLALPEAAVRNLGWMAVDKDLLEATRRNMGLSGPWYQQYFEHLSHLLRGDLGKSTHGHFDVAHVVVARLLKTVPLWLVSLAMLATIPIPLASTYASNRVPKPMLWIRTLTTVGLLPPFLTAIAAAFLFDNYVSPTLPVFVKPIGRIFAASLSVSIMPMAVVFASAANMFERFASQPFVSHSYLAIGADWPRIRLLLFKNVLLSLRSQMSRVALLMLLGTAFTEFIFDIHGFGHLLIEGLRNSDFPILFGWTLLSSSVVLMVTIIEEIPSD